MSSSTLQGATQRFVHTGKETSCSSCHESERPAPSIDPSSGKSYAHGDGKDCIACHAINQQAGNSDPNTWTSGLVVFNHTPTPSYCINCHVQDRPTTVLNGFDHSVAGLGDCISCHVSGAGSSWKQAAFSHTPTPSTCITCHTGDRPTGVVKGFDHAAGGMGDCVSCHTNTTTFSGAKFNHTPTPTTCVACHASDRPTQLEGAFNHATDGAGDCVFCHLQPGVSWAGTLFNHAPLPTQCASCHEGLRPPTATIPTLFPNPPTVIQGHFAGTDCFACHLPRTDILTTFGFNHVSADNQQVKTCLPCHAATGLQHHKKDKGDCIQCHVPTGFDVKTPQMNPSPTPSHSMSR